MKTIIQHSLVLIAGIIIGWFISKRLSNQSINNNALLPSIRYPLSVKLYKFRLNSDSMHTYHEWVKWQHAAHVNIIKSLEREKMYTEAVFRDTINDSTSIYWLAINGMGGTSYENSPLAVDSIHAAFMQRILQKGSRQTLQTAFTLIPPFLEQSIAIHQQEEK